MKSLFEKAEREGILYRISQLSPSAKNIWGKMSVDQAVCHLSDPFRDFLGLRKPEIVTSPEMQTQLQAMVIVEPEWDHDLPTFPPYLQDEGGGGTKPTSFEQDRNTLVNFVNKFADTPTDFSYGPHSGLGVMTRDQVGKLMWKHLDHHLREFGV